MKEIQFVMEYDDYLKYSLGVDIEIIEKKYGKVYLDTHFKKSENTSTIFDEIKDKLKEAKIYSLEGQHQIECQICLKKINSYLSTGNNKYCKDCFIDLVFKKYIKDEKNGQR